LPRRGRLNTLLSPEAPDGLPGQLEAELEAFVAEGLVILDRPLTWEIVGELLAALPPGAQSPEY
jgi:hypothetical protein